MGPNGRLETRWRARRRANRFSTAARWPGMGGKSFEALLSDEDFPYSNASAQSEAAAVAVLLSADLFRAAVLAEGAVRNNSDWFADKVSVRGVVFASSRPSLSIPWFTKVGTACGLFSGRNDEPARRNLRKPEKGTLGDATYLRSRLRMVSYKLKPRRLER